MGRKKRGNARLGTNARVGHGCLLGMPKERSLLDRSVSLAKADIGSGVLLQNYVIIGEGSWIGNDSVVEDRCRIGYGCHVGIGTRIMYGAYICDRVMIGDRARVAGFVCDGSIIEEGASSFGNLVHVYAHPDDDWWGPDEPAPIVGSGAVIGFGALVIGGIRIGGGSY